MAKIKSALIAKSSNIPENKTSIALQKESVQETADKKLITYDVPYSFEALAQLYDMNSYHSRCCKVKAGVTVLLGFSINNPEEDKEQNPDDGYKKIDALLNSSLNELYNVQLDHEIFGNGYLEIVRNNKKEIAELYHIPARYTQLINKNDKMMLKQTVGTTELYYKPFEGEKYQHDDKMHEYIHIKSYNPNSRFYGVPDYMGAVAAMYLDNSANEFNTRRFINNALPDSIIKMYGFDKDSDAENDIKNFFQGNFKGVENAGKVLLLWAEDKEKNTIEVDKMSGEIKEASFRGLRMDNREEVLAAHGVPARLAGVESAAKLSGGNETREQLKLFNEIVIIPKQKALARILNNLILTGLGIKNWEVKFNTFEFANAAEDSTFYQIMVTSGILDANEARVEMGYPPREDEPTKPEDDSTNELTKQDETTRLVKEATKAIRQLTKALEDLKD
jgi:PBSX family phage portal protein